MPSCPTTLVDGARCDGCTTAQPGGHNMHVSRSSIMNARVYIKTFGCQMNEYDSAKMAEVLATSHGYVPVEQPEEAEIGRASCRERV